MSRLKYVMTDKGAFALFSEKGGISHADVARAIMEGERQDVTGGGFANLTNKDIPVMVYGQSVSAKVDSSDMDAEHIAQAIDQGEAFQLYVEEDVLGMPDLWILTNSSALEASLNARIANQNARWRKNDPISPVKKEGVTLAELSQDATVERYHIPSMF